MAYSVIFNEGIFSLNGLRFDYPDGASLDVNGLHSDIVVDQRGSTMSSLVVTDCEFVGGVFALWIRFAIPQCPCLYMLVV